MEHPDSTRLRAGGHGLASLQRRDLSTPKGPNGQRKWSGPHSAVRKSEQQLPLPQGRGGWTERQTMSSSCVVQSSCRSSVTWTECLRKCSSRWGEVKGRRKPAGRPREDNNGSDKRRGYSVTVPLPPTHTRCLPSPPCAVPDRPLCTHHASVLCALWTAPTGSARRTWWRGRG